MNYLFSRLNRLWRLSSSFAFRNATQDTQLDLLYVLELAISHMLLILEYSKRDSIDNSIKNILDKAHTNVLESIRYAKESKDTRGGNLFYSVNAMQSRLKSAVELANRQK